MQKQRIKKVSYEVPPIFIMQPSEINPYLFGKQKKKEVKKK
jgi:hypothetical protein